MIIADGIACSRSKPWRCSHCAVVAVAVVVVDVVVIVVVVVVVTLTHRHNVVRGHCIRRQRKNRVKHVGFASVIAFSLRNPWRRSLACRRRKNHVAYWYEFFVVDRWYVGVEQLM